MGFLEDFSQGGQQFGFGFFLPVDAWDFIDPADPPCAVLLASRGEGRIHCGEKWFGGFFAIGLMRPMGRIGPIFSGARPPLW